MITTRPISKRLRAEAIHECCLFFQLTPFAVYLNNLTLAIVYPTICQVRGLIFGARVIVHAFRSEQPVQATANLSLACN